MAKKYFMRLIKKWYFWVFFFILLFKVSYPELLMRGGIAFLLRGNGTPFVLGTILADILMAGLAAALIYHLDARSKG